MKPIFNASLMCVDFLNLKEDMAALNSCCHMLHADVLDGHFRRNIALSPDLLKAMCSCSDLPVDIHLMVTNPWEFIELYGGLGAKFIQVHAETICGNELETFWKIRSKGARPGLVINPEIPLDSVIQWLPYINILTVMTVSPGFAGSPFEPAAVEKIRIAKEIIEKENFDCILQADGHIGKDTYQTLWQAGTQCFVMGTTGLFGIRPTLAESGIAMKKEFTDATGVIL